MQCPVCGHAAAEIPIQAQEVGPKVVIVLSFAECPRSETHFPHGIKFLRCQWALTKTGSRPNDSVKETANPFFRLIRLEIVGQAIEFDIAILHRMNPNGNLY